MKIGIVVFSQTGNTFSVAERLGVKFSEKKIENEVIKLEVSGDPYPGSKNFKVHNKPDLSIYDAYVFASPVQAFTLAAAMKMYLKDISTIEGKKAAVFATQHLKPVFGGNRTIKKLTSLINNKGGEVLGSFLIGWKRPDRDEMIEKGIQELANLFN